MKRKSNGEVSIAFAKWASGTMHSETVESALSIQEGLSTPKSCLKGRNSKTSFQFQPLDQKRGTGTLIYVRGAAEM